MGVPRKNFFVSLILEAINLDVPLIPLESPYEWLARKKRIARRQYRDALRGLAQRGDLKIVKRQNKEFIKLSQKGALRTLLEKARVCKVCKWDGKWRVLVFDIPEDYHVDRDRFRRLLKQNNFVKLQDSVFVSPYPLSRDALRYLKDAGLMEYVRIMKVEEMDDDKDLRKKFNL